MSRKTNYNTRHSKRCTKCDEWHNDATKLCPKCKEYARESMRRHHLKKAIGMTTNKIGRPSKKDLAQRAGRIYKKICLFPVPHDYPRPKGEPQNNVDLENKIYLEECARLREDERRRGGENAGLSAALGLEPPPPS